MQFATIDMLVGGILYPLTTQCGGIAGKIDTCVPFMKRETGNGVVAIMLVAIWYQGQKNNGVTMYDVGGLLRQGEDEDRLDVPRAGLLPVSDTCVALLLLGAAEGARYPRNDPAPMSCTITKLVPARCAFSNLLASHCDYLSIAMGVQANMGEQQFDKEFSPLGGPLEVFGYP
ncbi:MAG: hypothetical protein PHP20_09100 [Firmicutes bacterium]|nr:hypothetical protein [Bacillota bacterium]